VRTASRLVLLVAVLPLLLAAEPAPRGDKYFKITVVDEDTGRGVPLVELRTTDGARWWTDSNGVVAFHEPGLMGQTVFFHVKSHGYEFPKDGFGFRGKALEVKEGGSAVLKVKRLNVAERLYRVTGGGIYRDSALVGEKVATREPLLNAQVFGSDSVVNAVYRGKLYWFWGDTTRPAYPLGNFNVPGATSRLPADGGLDPAAGVDLNYFVDDKGFAKATCPMPGPGPTWISGLVTLPDRDGRERLYAAYVKVRGQLDVYQHGLAVFDDDKQQFEKFAQFDEGAPVYPGGHPFKRKVDGVEYVFFASPYPLVRVRADAEHLKDLTKYESFTPLKEGSRLDKVRLDRDAGGALRYGWKKDTPPLSPKDQDKLVRDGQMKPEEALLHLRDVDTGKPVLAHSGSVYWNDYRKRWVMIALQLFGTSVLGEVWYAEGDTPLGPWVYARKVISHEQYSFYNPKQHPAFDQDGGRLVYLEGTYASTFSGNAEQTPRYDYNQVMYRLDLADERLRLPVPAYALGREGADDRFATLRQLDKGPGGRAVAFFALDRPGKGTVPVHAGEAGLEAGTRPGTPLFHALPADMKEPPATAVPLYEFVPEDGKKRAYSIDADATIPGYRRAEKPLCLVWRNPIRVALPSQ
jgi:hypothetical protein